MSHLGCAPSGNEPNPMFVPEASAGEATYLAGFRTGASGEFPSPYGCVYLSDIGAHSLKILGD